MEGIEQTDLEQYVEFIEKALEDGVEEGSAEMRAAFEETFGPGAVERVEKAHTDMMGRMNQMAKAIVAGVSRAQLAGSLQRFLPQRLAEFIAYHLPNFLVPQLDFDSIDVFYFEDEDGESEGDVS